MAAVNPGLTQAQAETLLKATAIADYRCSEGCGAGLVDAHAAVLSSRDGGNTPGDPGTPPRLGVATTQLSFTGSGTQNLLVRNLGGGTLQVTATSSGVPTSVLSFPSGNALSVPALGSKQLQVAVNTSGVSPGSYLAQLTLTGVNGAGAVQLLVKLQAGRAQGKDAVIAFLYQDPVTAEWMVEEEGVALVPASGGYRYSLKLTPRIYVALATIDDDGDEQLFEENEPVGFWRNIDAPEFIEVRAGRTVSNIDFDMVAQAPFDDSPALDVGAACTGQAQCPGGFCATNYPGGYCTQDCTIQNCPAGSKCYLFENATAAYCLASCSSPSDCRTGYTCYDDRAGGGICQPL
jgi:serine protease